ncbi:AAA family ATPase [Methylobacterium sp. C25]|uniref:AAA family ATPase n=1 Tax=Methylobacterium sp. C25 TaxID=2721622 RepID=UPI001F3B8E3A|nr:AAA family ATPase [Methylobacterium sp. C25]MCE4226682.1 AAA family ATPase [Methylobacterium sp. C25]
MTRGPRIARSPAVDGARLFLKLRKRALVAADGRRCGPLGPAAAAASAVIGATLGRVPGLIEQLLDAGPVVIVVEAADDDWAAALGRAVRECVLTTARLPPKVEAGGYKLSKALIGADPRKRSAAPVRVFAGPSRISEKESKDALSSIGDMSSVVAIAREPCRELPPAVLRAADHRLVACPLDADLLALVVAAVAGSRPKKTLPAELMRLLDLDDIRLALHRDRGADGCIERLEHLTQSRLTTQVAVPRLSDLAGYGAAREIGMGIARDLNAYRSGLPWSRIERGILLFGPPGTGKTLFAKSLASQANLPFVAGSLTLWQAAGDGHLGSLLKSMRTFFSQARALAPAIAFIDEIDNFGTREKFGDAYAQYWRQAVTCLLECLDGVVDREGVLVVAATNNIRAIDPAILRSGRFDRRIEIGLPGFDDLRGILRFHLEDELSGEDLGTIARRMLGSSAADCAAVVRRARGTARQAERQLTMADLLADLGDGRTTANPETERRTAIHESGHAIVAHALGISVGDIGLLPLSGVAGGFTRIGTPEVATRETCRALLSAALAGRAAEVAMTGEASAGSASDLAWATEIARSMHAEWGLGSWLSVRGPGRSTARLDALVESEIRRAFERATAIVETRRRQLELLADILLERRALTETEVDTILITSLKGPDRMTATSTVEAER